MRTDVKIGVAVGILIVIVVVCYYAFFADGGSGAGSAGGQPASGEVANASGHKGAERDRPALPTFGGVSPATRPARPRIGEEPLASVSPPVVRPTVRETPASREGPRLPAVPLIRERPAAEANELAAAPVRRDAPAAPSFLDTPASRPARESPGPTIRDMGVSPAVREGPRILPGREPNEPGVAPSIRETSVTPLIRETPRRPATPEAPVTPVISEPIPGPRAPTSSPGPRLDETATGERIYVVQKGDAGFWAIAEKVYNDGRLWTLIAKANPNAESNALREGQKLKIPPKPAARPTEGRPTEMLAGPTGQRVYVVKSGDAGFWGIAQTVYGDGRHWTLIAKANPQVTSGGLRPGMKLVIPPLTTSSAGAASRPGPTTATIAPALGQKVYVVKAGDAGFWGVAQAEYGDGRFAPWIAKANPQVSSSALKPGQQLIIPELTEEMRRSVTGTAPVTATTRPAGAGGEPKPKPRPRPRPEGDGRPVFD